MSIWLPKGAERAPTLLKEDFSIAYIRAIVAQLQGYVREVERDEDSIDMVIACNGYYSDALGRKVAPKSMHLQVKCSADIPSPSPKHPDRFAKRIPAKNYADLTAVGLAVPHLLVVVRCPKRPSDRVRWTDRNLRMHGRAWWVDLEAEIDLPGHGALTPKQKNKTVYIPFRQRLTAAALGANMCSP